MNDELYSTSDRNIINRLAGSPMTDKENPSMEPITCDVTALTQSQ